MSQRSDPWISVPNLSRVTSSTLEETRAGDPSRFYGQPGTGDVVSDRIQNVPRASVYYSTLGLTIGVGTSIVTWDAVEYDPYGMWNASAPTRLTAHMKGVFRCTTWVAIGAGAVGDRYIWFKVNGNASSSESPRSTPGTVTVNSWIGTTAEIELDAGGYVEVAAGQTSGGALPYLGTTLVSHINGFQMVLASTIGTDTL